MNLFIKILYQVSQFVMMLIKPATNGVRILMTRNDQILLVKHRYEDKWFLPGGLVDRGETFDEAVRREALEEVGATLNNLKLFGTYTNIADGRNDHVVVFLSNDFCLNGSMDHEIQTMSFFEVSALPEDIATGSKNRIDDYINGEEMRFGSW